MPDSTFIQMVQVKVAKATLYWLANLWKSNMVCRVTRLTQVAKTLAFSDGCDAAYLID